jgi:HPt (histidine-containing phosphotransfer) domain-containing protein
MLAPERGSPLSETATIVDWDKFSRMRFELGANFVRILGYFREDGEKSVATIEDAMHRQDAAAIVLPAHTMKAEARQFGAEPLADLAEQIEFACRRAVESHLFPDNILPEVAKLRPLYSETMALLEEETNPLAQRRSGGGFGKKPSNQEFGRL